MEGKTVVGFNYQIIEDAAKELYIRALKFLPPDVTTALEKAYERETSDTAKKKCWQRSECDPLQRLVFNPPLAKIYRG